ncbi:MAG: methyltransferase domain-containing protein [Candidatus Eisenbacteria bacterium]|nr:methyltransferase domain-containing protein [Candidatus Eisenbacteria bacterium]
MLVSTFPPLSSRSSPPGPVVSQAQPACYLRAGCASPVTALENAAHGENKLAGDWTDTFFGDAWDRVVRHAHAPGQSRAEAEFIHQALRLRPGSRVLDAPCGDGRIALGLAELGCRVVGVDSARRSIGRARRLARASGLDVDFRLGDMRALDVEGRMSAVVNWWSSFGYFDEETNLRLMRDFAGLTRRGGRVLIDQINRERVLRDFRESAWDEYGPVRVHVRNRWNPESERIEGVWTFTEGNERSRRRTSMRVYTPRQMERLMDKAGLGLERLYGWIDGSEYSRGSRRMIAVGRRG